MGWLQGGGERACLVRGRCPGLRLVEAFGLAIGARYLGGYYWLTAVRLEGSAGDEYFKFESQ
jgi:hypothetical protein